MKILAIQTLEEYKGYQIDVETEAPDRVVIYDPSSGEYICEDPLHSVEEAKEYIDNMDKSQSSLLSEMQKLLKEEKSESMEMDEFSGLEELDAIEGGYKIFKNEDKFEVHKDGKTIMANLSEKPSNYTIKKYVSIANEAEEFVDVDFGFRDAPDVSFLLDVKAKDNHGNEHDLKVKDGVLLGNSPASPPMGWNILDILDMTEDSLLADLGQGWSIENIQEIKKDIASKLVKTESSSKAYGKLPKTEELDIYEWDAFEYRDEEMDVDDYLKFAKHGDIEDVYTNFYHNIADQSSESVRYIIKEQGLEEELEQLQEEDPKAHDEYLDEIRYAIEDKMNFNIEQVLPTPVLIYNPSNKFEVSGPMYVDEEYAEEEENSFAELARQAGFSDEAIAECYSEATQGGMAKIGVLVDDADILKKIAFAGEDEEIQIKGEPLLVIHNEWNGSGYYVDGGDAEYSFSAKKEDILDNFDSGRYSMGAVFGTDQWKS